MAVASAERGVARNKRVVRGKGGVGVQQPLNGLADSRLGSARSGPAGEGHPKKAPKRPRSEKEPESPSRQLTFEARQTGALFSRGECAFTAAILATRFEEQGKVCAQCRGELPTYYDRKKKEQVVIADAHHVIPIALAKRLQIPVDFVRSKANCAILCTDCHRAITAELRLVHFCRAIVDYVLFQKVTTDHSMLSDYRLPFEFLSNPVGFLHGLAYETNGEF